MQRLRTIGKSVVIGILAVLPFAQFANSLPLPAQSTNAQVMATGSNWTAATVRVGETGASSYGCATVFPFALPVIPFGNTITGVTFSINVAGLRGGTFNGDLYSIGISTSPAVSGTSDYYQGAWQNDHNPLVKPIQQHFLTTSTTIGKVSANYGGSVAIADDLQSIYDGGAGMGWYYFLRVSPDFTVATGTNAGWDVSLTQDTRANWPSLSIATAPQIQEGRVLLEYWTGVSGTNVSDLTSSPSYPNKPSSREYSKVMEIPANLDTNSGVRLRGVFYPPAPGNYSFAIAGDDNAVLLLGTNASPGSATQIASASLTGYQQWSGTSSPRNLAAGQGYYIEARQKQGSGTSNMSVGYLPPGAGSVSLMPTTDVAPYDPGLNYVSGTAAAVGVTAHPRLLGLSPAAVARLKAAIAVPGSVENTIFSTISTHSVPLLSATAPLINPAQVGLYQAGVDLKKYSYFLGLNYLLTNSGTTKTACLEAMWKQLQAADQWGTSGTSGATSWNTSSYLDVSEISNAFSIAYDWGYAGWTSDRQTFLRNAIVNHALNYAVQSYNTPQQWWVTGSNNWGAVCDGGMVFSALAVLGDETAPGVAPTVLNEYIPALQNVPVLAKFAPDGCLAESACYWDFAVQYLVAALSSLESSQGTCYNIDKLDGLPSAGSFPLYFHGPNGRLYNWGDEDGDGYLSSPWERYLGIKYNQPIYSWTQQQHSAYNDPKDLIWYDSRLTTATPTNLHVPTSTYYQNGPIFLRTAWNDPNALFVGMKAGPNFVQHNNLEAGSFVFDALGVRWACELGRDSYGLPHYFYDSPWSQPTRWQYYRKRTEGSNTLVIDPSAAGGQAYYTGAAVVTNFKSNTDTQLAVVDMTSAYSMTDDPANPSQVSTATPVTRVQRGMRFVNGAAQLQDEVTSSSGVDLNWFMHTAISGSNIVLTSGSTVATLTSGTTHLKMVIQSPAGAKFSTMAAVPLPSSPDYAAFQTNPPTNSEAWNTGITKLRIEVPNSTSTIVTVGMSPYFDGQTPPAPPPMTVLSHW